MSPQTDVKKELQLFFGRNLSKTHILYKNAYQSIYTMGSVGFQNVDLR